MRRKSPVWNLLNLFVDLNFYLYCVESRLALPIGIIGIEVLKILDIVILLGVE